MEKKVEIEANGGSWASTQGEVRTRLEIAKGWGSEDFFAGDAGLSFRRPGRWRWAIRGCCTGRAAEEG